MATTNNGNGDNIRGEASARPGDFLALSMTKRAASGIHTGAFKGKIGKRLAELDKNGDGMLDAEELTSTIEQLLSSERDKKLLKWLLVTVTVLFLCLIGVIAGLTYGIVQASKDTRVSGGVLQDKETGKTLLVGTTTSGQFDWVAAVQPDALPQLLGLETLTLQGNKGTVTIRISNIVRYTDGDYTYLMFTCVDGAFVVKVSSLGQVNLYVKNNPGVPSDAGLEYQMTLVGSALSGGGSTGRRRLSATHDDVVCILNSADCSGDACVCKKK